MIFEIWIFIIILGVTFANWTPCLGQNGFLGREWRWNQHTVIWRFKYCSTWIISTSEQTTSPADIDTNYQLLFIINETTGNFNSAGAITLTHKLNNFTMSEAPKWYPTLKPTFLVQTYKTRSPDSTDIYPSTWSPLVSHSTRWTCTRRPTIHCWRSSSVHPYIAVPISLHWYVPSLLSCQWSNRYLRPGSSHRQ